MQLKIRKTNKKIYNLETLQEDLKGSKTVRMVPGGIEKLYQEEGESISKAIKEFEKLYPEYHNYLVKALSLCDFKIDKIRKEKTKGAVKLLENEVVARECVT